MGLEKVKEGKKIETLLESSTWGCEEKQDPFPELVSGQAFDCHEGEVAPKD